MGDDKPGAVAAVLSDVAFCCAALQRHAMPLRDKAVQLTASSMNCMQQVMHMQFQ
jgi:hypothetical protein